MSTKVPIRHQGNENLFLALEMSLICTVAGIPLHIHAEGLRGTGKTTVMRWARKLAPDIQRIQNCLYQCHPELPHCPNHANHDTDCIQSEIAPMPFIEIGHGAKLGTILGSVDLARLTDPQNPEAAILPGSIPMANRGIIFIDEVNRIAETAPEITDVLLSAMGTKPGKIKIEEVGLMPWEIKINSSVWATSNPDEDPGPLEEIRRQLSDRFDMVVPVQRPSDPLVIQKLLWGKTRGAPEPETGPAIASKIQKTAASLANVIVPQTIIRYMADLYVEKNVESLRAIESLELSSRCLAAIRGKQEVSFDELLTVLPLVLRHRVEPIVLSEIVRDLELRKAASVQIRPNAKPKQDTSTPVDSKPSGNGDKDDQDGNGNCLEPDSNLPSSVPAKTNRERENPISQKGLPENNGQKPISWFRRILSHCQRSLSRSGVEPNNINSRTRNSVNRYPDIPDTRRRNSNQSSSTGTQQDPESIFPVSPPEKARRIGYLTWEEILLPSEWKDYI